MLSYSEPLIQQIHSDDLEKARIRLFIKREDQNHRFVSGNKWWKLKYNLEEARQKGLKKILTFGGAFSNHLFATAAAAKEYGLESIGIVRGEETHPLNPTLVFTRDQGMQLHYVSREEYRQKSSPDFLKKLKTLFGVFYLIPEGGTNQLAVKGCEEWGQNLLAELDFDYLCLPVGTGGTLAGLVVGVLGKKNVTGFSVLKGAEYLQGEVRKMFLEYSGKDFGNWRIETGYHFGGYAKISSALNDFTKSFHSDHGIPLDPIYTGKMMFGIFDLIRQQKFERGSTILAIHTGGLQGKG